MKTAEIICTGTELLMGNSVDTNSVYLSNRLQELGVIVEHKSIVGDDKNHLIEVIQHALNRVDIIILSGGLGPTVDDLTREVVAELAGVKLLFHKEILDKIMARIRLVHAGRIMPDSVKLQAYVPEGAEYFINRNGTAPGLVMNLRGKIVICLPGPPRELKPMWDNQVHEWLKKHLPDGHYVICRVLRMNGLPESVVDEKISELLRNSINPKVGICATPGSVDIRLIGWGKSREEADSQIAPVESQIRSLFGETIYGIDQDTLESKVGELLKNLNWKLSLAESCTGGLIAHRMTNISGSSDYFDRCIVTYSNRAKMEQLNVPESVLQQFGAVSEETAIAMAKGIQSISGSDVALSVTGIAGPSGGSAEKPVGLIYIALAKKDHSVECKKYLFSGERELIKFRSSQEALDLLLKYLLTQKSK